jgi:hypothetical protein
MPVLQPVQYGRECANKSSVQAVHLSLEVYMHERRHHLNESSSARLGGSQQLEILPSPNSKRLNFGWAPKFWTSAELRRLIF